jgi:hypothetical protein
VSQLNPGDIAHRLSEKSENQIKQGSSNAVMSRPMSDKADSLLEGKLYLPHRFGLIFITGN